MYWNDPQNWEATFGNHLTALTIAKDHDWNLSSLICSANELWPSSDTPEHHEIFRAHAESLLKQARQEDK
jgi:hypothetical protein